MAIGQRIKELLGPDQHVLLRQRILSLNTVGQIFPLDEPHHQVAVASLLEEVSDIHQVGMVQASQNHRLLLELPAQLGQHVGIEA
jgi:hypothetical protein